MATAIGSTAPHESAGEAKEAIVPDGKPNILVIWGDDIDISNLSCYSDGVNGIPHAEHRSIASEGMRSPFPMVSRVAPPAAPHPSVVKRVPHRDEQGRRARRADRLGRRGPHTSPNCSSLWVMPPPFGKNTSAISTSTYRRCTASTSSSATCTTSTPKRNRRARLSAMRTVSAAVTTHPNPAASCGARRPMRNRANQTIPSSGRGGQIIEDTGPLNKKRMETIDDDIADATVDYIKRQHAEDTIVIYSTDPTARTATPGPDAGTTPFRSEKNGVQTKSSSTTTGCRHWAAAGDPDISEQAQEGLQDRGTEYKAHIDGFNLLPYLTGEVDTSPRRGFFYILRRRRPGGHALRELEGRLR